MEDVGAQRIREAIEKYGPVQDRWVLRLGKDDGEFEAWHLPAEDFAEDFAGFLACLNLTRIVDTIDTRIKDRKKAIREAKKAARAVQKALDKAAEKVRKAEEKAAAKLVREAEKQRIKAEAKAERDRLKAQVKVEKENPSLPSAGQSVNSLNPEEVMSTSETHEGGAEVSVGLAPSQAAAPALSKVEYDDEPQYKPIVIPED